MALLISLLISLPGIFWAREFLVLMGTTEEAAAEYALYPAIIFGSNGIVMLLFIINAISEVREMPPFPSGLFWWPT